MLLRLQSNLYHQLPTTGPCYCHAHELGWQNEVPRCQLRHTAKKASPATASFENSKGLPTLTQGPAGASIQLQEQTPLLQLAELLSPLQVPEWTKLCQQKALFLPA